MTTMTLERDAAGSAVRTSYVAPSVTLDAVAVDETNEAFWAPLGWILLYWGGAAAWCSFICRGKGVKKCKTHWYGSVEATCR